jgi:hypothetical protein
MEPDIMVMRHKVRLLVRTTCNNKDLYLTGNLDSGVETLNYGVVNGVWGYW